MNTDDLDLRVDRLGNNCGTANAAAGADSASGSLSTVLATAEWPLDSGGRSWSDRVAVASPGLPASVGIASVKFLAKMASKAAKPDGLMVIDAGDERRFLAPLGVAELWGVGQATLATLHGLGIESIGQLAGFPPEVLRRHLGAATAAHLAALSVGQDPRHVDTERDAKSVSVESTYPTDITDPDEIERALLELCHRLSGRLLKSHLAGKTLNLKVRFGDFTTVTRSVTRDQHISDTSQLWPLASELLKRAGVGDRGVRLLGVGVTGFAEDEPTQLALDGSDRTALAEATSEVRERFGEDAVRPARLAPSPAENVEG